jgi:hypothetical protein
MNNFNKGDTVLCVKQFMSENSPKLGKAYTVFLPYDDCGCGYRILLNEIECGYIVPWRCGMCRSHNSFYTGGGWAANAFIKIGDVKLTKEIEEERTVLNEVELDFTKDGTKRRDAV